MNFVSPIWLVSLLVWIPLLYWFYSRKNIRRRIPVSSLYLWKKLQTEIPLNTANKRHNLPLSFYLFALALTGLCTVLAGPFRNVEKPIEILFLFENSARIGSKTSAGQTRLELLKTKAQEILKTLPGSSSVRLHVFPVGMDQRGNAGKISSTLETLETVSLPCNLEEEVAKHIGFAGAESSTVFLFTDRTPSNLPHSWNLIARGEASRNVGWTNLDIREGVAHLRVQNFSPQLQSRTWKIQIDGETKKSQRIELATAQSSEIAASLQVTAKRIEIILEDSDDLEADDRIVLVRGKNEFRIALPVHSSASLRRAFQSIPNTVLLEWKEKIPQSSDMDLIVLDRNRNTDQANVLFWDEGAIFVPKSIHAATDQELGQLLNFEGVQISRAYEANQFSGEILAYAKDDQDHSHPLLTRDGKRLVFYFRLEDSNWNTHPSFPVFWAAWIESLRQESGGFRVESALLDPEQSANAGESREILHPLIQTQDSEKHDFGQIFLLSSIALFLAAWLLESHGK